MTISRQYLQSFHDAEFGTLSADHKAKTAAVLLHRDDGSRAGFSFEGVRMLRASEFLHQNVVSRILLSTVNPERFEIGDIVRWACTVDGKACITDVAFHDVLQRIAAAELRLFYVDPSVGGEIAILADVVRAATTV